MFTTLLQPVQEPLSAPARRLEDVETPLPPAVQAAIWRGDQLGSMVSGVVPTGFPTLNEKLPGGGWPCQAVTEILCAQFSVLEWRLLSPALKQICAGDKAIAVVSPPKPPHIPGLRHEGLSDRHLIWIDAAAPAQRLWVLEQLIKSNAFGAVVGWLPQVRQEQIRRLQVLANGCRSPVFLCRPSLAAVESSAAPLRVQARVGPGWELFVDILKRKGPPVEETLRLASIPGGLSTVITPRIQTPSRLMKQERHDVVDSFTPEQRSLRHSVSH